MLTAAVVPAQAGKNKITICHFPPGNPENVQTIEINENAWDAHEEHGDHKGACTPDDYPPTVTPTHTPTETPTGTPTDTPTGTPTGTPTETPTGTPTPEGTEEPCSDCETPIPTATPVPTIVVEEPALLQITVWPETAQMTSNVVGFMWKANGSWVYADRNRNGAEDPGERIITGTEYRDRPVWGTSTIVYGQSLSRLVTGVRLGEVGDLNAFLSSFEAYLVMNDGTLVRAYGWYDIDGEWMPLGADGVSQYRPQ
jgi:hypothetical protein